jgi:(p)ppGpp synthase/HD superfamily hydrolase
MSLNICESDFGLFLKALRYTAAQHRDQRRKGGSQAPYINHPIGVAEILWSTGEVRDITTLVAALLHDTIEDTSATPEEIREQFGEEVLSVVQEVTDDKSLPKEERKRLQVVTAPHKSPRARKIKLADKINNVTELAYDPPEDWSTQRRREYLDWTEQVINGLRGQNPALEARYDQVLAEARQKLREGA